MNKAEFNKELIDLSGELLEDKYSLRFIMKGNSMYPVFREGDTGIVARCDVGELKRGDIIVFRSGDKLIAHRLIKTVVKDNNTSFIARGDKNYRDDHTIKADDIIGKIVCFQNGSRQKKTDSFMFRITGFMVRHLNRILVPVFNLMLKLHSFRKKLPGGFRSFISNLKFISKGSEKKLLQNLVISVLQGVLPFAVIFCLKWLIDSLALIDGSDHQSLRPFIIILGLTASIFLLNAITAVLRNYFFEKLSFSVSMHVHDTLHKKHSSLDMSWYEDSEQQDKMHRAVQEAGFRPVKITSELLQMVRSLVGGLAIIALFLTVKWYIVFILLLAISPGILIRLRHSGRLYRLKRENSSREREVYYYNRVLTGLPFAKELKLFAFSRYFQARFRTVHDSMFRHKDRLNRSIMRQDLMAQTFAVLLVFGIFGYISFLAVSGQATIGTVAMSFLILQRGYSVLGELSKSATRIVEDNIFLNDLIGFLNIPDREDAGSREDAGHTGGAGVIGVAGDMEDKGVMEDAGHTGGAGAAGGMASGPLKKGIFIENVTFRYKPGHKNALDNVNIVIPFGETVAFAGKNGSGKTTMIKLLCGFYRPDSGRILFDDTDLTQMDPSAIRERITAVFQDFALYNMTALENIALGNIQKKVNPQLARKAAEEAGISDVIEKLPGGYGNMLGPLFEGGNELSIGQWQKLAIARAFYRDSPILLFDEPSSALDAETEIQVLMKLKKLSVDKTVIIISHRSSAIKSADLIYVFDDGRIKGSGKWQELKDKNIL